jgi:hypothetical protein
MSLSLGCFCSNLFGSNVLRVTNIISVRKPRVIVVFAHRCFTTEASMKVASMGFLSTPKPTNFQHVRCDARKERRSTCCSLSSTNTNDSSNKSGGDDSEVTETEGETNDNRMPSFFLYYTISIDGRQSRILKAKVHKGDDIDSIIDEIKKKGSPDFDSIPAYRIELYESLEQEEPLNALEEWYPNVTWGTKQQPLVVKINRLETSPWNTNDSTYIIFEKLHLVLICVVMLRFNNRAAYHRTI